MKNSFWVLIVADLTDNTICLVNPLNQPSTDYLDSLLKDAALTITQLTLHGSNLVVIPPPPSQSNPHTSNSGPLICGYMWCISKKKGLFNIDVKKIRKLANSLKKRFARLPSYPSENLVSTIPKRATLQTRKALAETLLSSISALPLSEAIELVVQHIYLLRSKTPKSNFMGLYQDCKLSVNELRNLFKSYPARAFKIITNNTEADCYPSEEAVYSYYNSKSVHIPINPKIRDLPVKHGPDFCFEPFTREDLETVAKSFEKSAPGRSSVTYADILYCDPDLSIHLALFNKILENNCVPQMWNDFDTLLIPKPMKQGHYDDIHSWRPIALLECQYKFFTAVLSRALHRWCLVND